MLQNNDVNLTKILILHSLKQKLKVTSSLKKKIKLQHNLGAKNSGHGWADNDSTILFHSGFANLHGFISIFAHFTITAFFLSSFQLCSDISHPFLFVFLTQNRCFVNLEGLEHLGKITWQDFGLWIFC